MVWLDLGVNPGLPDHWRTLYSLGQFAIGLMSIVFAKASSSCHSISTDILDPLSPPLRDVTIAQMGNGARECGWRHAPEARGGFGGFWKSQLSWVLPREKTVGFRLLAKARPVALWRVPHVLGVGGRWKSHHRKIVHLSSLCRNL